MIREFVIVTADSHPKHHVVGRRFRAYDGHIYVCDSYDSRIGYWMTREDAPPERRNDAMGEWRRNVSERAIGGTFHRID